jgi:replicative DNA helicase
VSLDEQALSWAIRYDGLHDLQSAGITREHFVDEGKSIWRFILKAKEEHGIVPSPTTIKHKYPDFYLPKVTNRDVPIIVTELVKRKKYKDFMLAMQEAAQNLTSFDDVDSCIQMLQGNLNQLSVQDNSRQHIADLFSPKLTNRITKELTKRNEAEIIGIPTGLESFDSLLGGLQKQKMAVIIGRTGKGKSWMCLFFAAQAVMSGYKVMLFPLEMNLYDTAARLYTIFSSQMFGASRALSNLDLTQGRVSSTKVNKFLKILENKFGGQLLVADMGSLGDNYTVERIGGEISIHRPDMFWVDYLTLLKPSGVHRGSESWQALRELSNGIKNLTMMYNIVGGCSAQVSREAIKANVYLPRLEHIAYGDALAQDSDQVFSMNRNRKGMHWALVKNRGGPEIGQKLVEIDLDKGVFREKPDAKEVEEEDG